MIAQNWCHFERRTRCDRRTLILYMLARSYTTETSRRTAKYTVRVSECELTNLVSTMADFRQGIGEQRITMSTMIARRATQ
jgi:hypothetical protein